MSLCFTRWTSSTSTLRRTLQPPRANVHYDLGRRVMVVAGAVRDCALLVRSYERYHVGDGQSSSRGGRCGYRSAAFSRRRTALNIGQCNGGVCHSLFLRSNGLTRRRGSPYRDRGCGVASRRRVHPERIVLPLSGFGGVLPCIGDWYFLDSRALNTAKVLVPCYIPHRVRGIGVDLQE